MSHIFIYMESIISDTNREIDQKIKNKVKPTHEDKKRIQHRIKQLDKQQQLHLFNEIIKNSDVYQVTENGTYFDLNDLSLEQFWKLQYHINLTYDCINRHKLINELEKQCHDSSLFNGENDIESASVWNDNHESIDVEDYNHLRILALSQCKYSEYYKKDTESTSKIINDHESKVVERNIYTDRRLFKMKTK